MTHSNSHAKKIAKVFHDFCNKKHYQIKQSEEANNLRIDISNLSERTILKVYHTGKIDVQGKQNTLKAEMEKLKAEFEADPQAFLGYYITEEIKACATRYDIMVPILKTKVKEVLDMLGTVEFTENPSSAVAYRARLNRNEFSLTVTQFNNGTLLLQGKTDKLFDECCDLIERTANPADKDVIARFISCDEENLKLFAAKYTPELIPMAESNVRGKIGNVFDYLEPYDQKWFVASECLCLTDILLPEFSPLVMPASKAFEGFAKKLIIGIGLVAADHFNTKQGKFSELNDTKNPKRMAICVKEKYADTMLKRLSLCLDMSRNFMMHSDDSKITKVDSQEQAEEKVNSIFKETKEIFNYFNDLFNLLPK
ncbi:MAG: hypothetical protein ABFD82_11535 [Syntrophaceae bacterium]